tara:strand:- start:1612 stop:2076 length:465 start_codon:yes stop_codon:yes gene_type:complete
MEIIEGGKKMMNEEKMNEETKKCADLVVGEMNDRIDELRRLYDAWRQGEDYEDDAEDEWDKIDCESIYDHGLGFDYVEPNTFDEQPLGYWRYQLSWGGPSDEFRYVDDGSIEYWYMEWFDSAHRILTGRDHAFMQEFAESFFMITHKGKWERDY